MRVVDMKRTYLVFLTLLLPCPVLSEERPLIQKWDYAAAMKKVAGNFKGMPGVILHIGDSITYSNPYGQWARSGQGKSEADRTILKWMNSGKDDDSDGWYLARFDHPAGGRSHTACSGIRIDEMLVGGKQKMPPLHKILDVYKPQMVVFMLGTNDASAMRKVDVFKIDFETAVDLLMKKGVIPIVSTIPPHPNASELAGSYNEAIRTVAREKTLPLIDYEKEILARRPNDWNGTLLSKNDVHPSASFRNTTPASAPTAENLKNSGYLLRGWLSVKKIAEVKTEVFDGNP